MTTVAAVLLALPLSAVRTVSNAVPRVDTDGNIVDAHSGNIVEMNGTYFLYGEFYGKCDSHPLFCTLSNHSLFALTCRWCWNRRQDRLGPVRHISQSSFLHVLY